MITETDIQNIKTALQCWDADDYDDWIHVGMALKADGYPFYIWDEWSRTGRSYKGVTETQYKWDSFRNNDGEGAITTKSIFKRAIEEGVRFDHNPDPKRRNPKDTDFAIPRDYVMGLKYDDGHLHLPAYVQLWRYLEVLYKPEDTIGVTTKKHTHLEEGKWKPAAGESVKVSNVISTLKSTMDIEKAVGDINPKAGAWIYLNTYDGKGFGNNNCVTFKYTLIECDKLTPAEQEKMYIERRLPIVALVTSGARSVHAVVRIDAGDIDEYSRRVRYMHDYLQKQGLPLDMGVGNPARMSRMPGVKRDGVEQSLLLIEGMDKLRTCCHDYLEWERYTKGETPKTADEKQKRDPLNFVYPMEYMIPPELPPAVICGLLRKGGKMVVTGAPKSHKTALLMELAVCMSEGLPFLGMDTLPTKTLYINTEYTEESCINRILNVRECMGLDRKLNKMLPTLNIKGKRYTIDELVTQLVEEHKDEGIGMVILDPIYKVMQGDENKAADMAVFLGWLDKLAVEMNCSVVYSHHHSKGSQGQKDAMDRGSGSGVISRDFDALIDVTRLEADEGVLKDDEEGWRFEFVARDFKSPDTMDTIFDYPIHRPDKDGILATAVVKGSPEYEAKIKSESSVKKREKGFTDIEKQLDAVFGTTAKEITILDAVKKIEALDWAEKIDIRTRRRKIQQHCETPASKYGYEVRARLGILYRK